MSSIMRLLAATALLGFLAGCANMGLPDWKSNASPDSMMNPPIYEPSPSN